MSDQNLDAKARKIAAGLDTSEKIAIEAAAHDGRGCLRTRSAGPWTSISLYRLGLVDESAILTDLGRAVVRVLSEGGAS